MNKLLCLFLTIAIALSSFKACAKIVKEWVSCSLDKLKNVVLTCVTFYFVKYAPPFPIKAIAIIRGSVVDPATNITNPIVGSIKFVENVRPYRKY